MNDHDVHAAESSLAAHEQSAQPGPDARELDVATSFHEEVTGRTGKSPVTAPGEIVHGATADQPSTPEAIEAAKIARASSSERPLDPRVRARCVEWVRPTDLMAREGAQLAGKGIDFQAAMAMRTRQKTIAGVRSLGERVKRLPPLSAFGRGTHQYGPSRSAVGSS